MKLKPNSAFFTADGFMILPDDEEELIVSDILSKGNIVFVDLVERVGKPSHIE